MSPLNWAGFIFTVMSIAGGVVASIRFLVKHYLAELKTNGGSSMRDEIKVIKMRQDEADQMRRDMDRKLDKMYDILIDYIARSSK